MKIVTLNANGLRACFRRGLKEWVASYQPDILCIQETKAQLSKLPEDSYAIEGYQVDFQDAQKAGYSGVAIYSKHAFHKHSDRSWEQHYIQHEARMQVMSFDAFDLINIYLPSGTMGDARQAIKWELLQAFRSYLQQWTDRACIVVGDFNVAHRPIDLKNWRSNQNSSGFLPYEREWLSALLEDGWVDTLRHLKPDLEQYTWWSLRARARGKNVGWRLDYQLINLPYVQAVKDAYVDDVKVLSDHAPYVVEYSYEKLLHRKLPRD